MVDESSGRAYRRAVTADVRLALLPGDGIGPEVLGAARAALEAVEDAAQARFVFDEIPCGGRYFLEHGRDWPEDAESRCDRADAILLGAVGWPAPEGSGPVRRPDGRMAGWSAVLGNRARLDLFANVRPVRLFPGIRHRISGRRRVVWRPEDVDLVIVRENTEDLYVEAGGILRTAGVGRVATDTRIITREGCERVCKLAFQIAERRDGAPRDRMKRVTAVLKDNVLEGCRLFAEVLDEVGRRHAGISREVVLVDAFAQSLIIEPERYDVVVTTNLFGDILTDVAAVLQGGLGMAVGCNLGLRHAMFEPIHGSAPPLAGRDEANPLAAVLAAAEALRWVGGLKGLPEVRAAGDKVEDAVRSLVADGAPLTRDLVGADRAASTSAVVAALVDRLS